MSDSEISLRLSISIFFGVMLFAILPGHDSSSQILDFTEHAQAIAQLPKEVNQ